MSEQAPESGEGQAPEQQPEQSEQQQPQETFDKEYVEKIRREAAEYRTKLRALERESEQQRKASMTEAERAVAEAETRGRQAAATEFGKRLARTEFDALAGRRNADFDTAPVFDYLDLSRFVGEDGEPDAKAIAAAVERLIPAPTGGPASFDGGARAPAPAPQSMSSVIRKAAGRG